MLPVIMNSDAHPKNIKRFGVISIVGWTFALAILLFTIIHMHRLDTMEDALRVARDYCVLNMEYRKWNSQFAGVYSLTSGNTTTNSDPFVPHRDIISSDGSKLTLINPHYMTQMVFDSISHNSENPIIGKLVSLNPLNPSNSPDDWERNSLQQFERSYVPEAPRL